MSHDPKMYLIQLLILQKSYDFFTKASGKPLCPLVNKIQKLSWSDEELYLIRIKPIYSKKYPPNFSPP